MRNQVKFAESAPRGPDLRPPSMQDGVHFGGRTIDEGQSMGSGPTSYVISLTQAPGSDAAEHVIMFNSAIEACAAARRLVRPGQRATIRAEGRMVGQISLALLSG